MQIQWKSRIPTWNEGPLSSRGDGASLQHRRIKKQATATPFAFFAFAQCATTIWTKQNPDYRHPRRIEGHFPADPVGNERMIQKGYCTIITKTGEKWDNGSIMGQCISRKKSRLQHLASNNANNHCALTEKSYFPMGGSWTICHVRRCMLISIAPS